MTTRGGEDDGLPRFSAPDVPCLQMLALSATLEDGRVVTFSTYQNDDVFGLTVVAQGSTPTSGTDIGGIYRSRELTELPRGHIQAVSVYVDEGVLAEVDVRIDAGGILLIAGEAEENRDGRLTWHRLDESVLVFRDRSIADGMAWIPHRGDLTVTA